MMKIALLALGTFLSFSFSANAGALQQQADLNGARACMKSDEACGAIGESFHQKAYMQRDCGFTPEVVIDDNVVEAFTGDIVSVVDQAFEGLDAVCIRSEKTYANAIKSIKVLHIKKGKELKALHPNLADTFIMSWTGPEFSIYVVDGPAFGVAASVTDVVLNH